MRSKRWFLVAAACAAQAVLGGCADVGVAPEAIPEAEGAESVAADGSAASGRLFPDPANDPRCEYVGSRGGVREYSCRTSSGAVTTASEGIFVCHYRVLISGGNGRVTISVQLLRCWTIDPGGGLKRVNLNLECTDKATRGSEAGCVASIKGDTENLGELVFEWKSKYAIRTDTATAENEIKWQGVPTDSTKVTLRVSGEEIADTSMTALIAVTPRKWTFDAMTHPTPTYSVAPRQADSAWGGYSTWIKDPGGVRPGSGPWKGRYYTDRPPQLRGEMHLHPDFDTSGPLYGLAAASTCSNVVADSANVLHVNTMCGLGVNLENWETAVKTHEQEHEDGANLCLLSGSAAEDVLAKMEKITGTVDTKVKDGYDAAFLAFFHGDFEKARETTTQTPSSPVIWEWRNNKKWTRQALMPASHSGTNGCSPP